MSERKPIIGLVGPSGVGKGYCKDALKTSYPDLFSEPVVATTRPQRPTDGIDRKAGIPLEEFMDMRAGGVVVLAHQPFGSSSHWYGFTTESLENNEKMVLTKVHVDNIEPFKQRYGDTVKLIALVADQDYLRRNLVDRNTESREEAQLRLEQAPRETELINGFSEQGLLDVVITVSDENRDELGKIVVGEVAKFL